MIIDLLRGQHLPKLIGGSGNGSERRQFVEVILLKEINGWSVRVLLCLVLASPTMGQDSKNETPSEALLRDAQAYAEQFDTDIEEAYRRLELQTRIGALDELLGVEAKESFGGLWIEHEPEFRIVMLFTEPTKAQELFSESSVGELAPLMDVRQASVTLSDLQIRLEEAETQIRSVGTQADLQINIRENRVEVLTPDPPRLAAAFAEKRANLPAGISVVQVDSLAQPSADVIGGRSVTDYGAGTGCTAGFAVRTHSGQLGLSTAGHCSNGQTYVDSFTPLTLKTEHFAGSHDVQWHTAACSEDVRNQVFDGAGNRTISSRVSRNSQAVGTYVCKYGRTTGATCGVIWSKSFCPSYVPNGRSTFITVIGNNIVDSGDSGGPWFVGNSAYGITSGKANGGDKAIYMAVNWMETVGYSVLTYQAGANPWANVSCYMNGIYGFSCSAAGNSGTPPYTYSNWQYWGPASNWNAGSSSINGSYAFPGCPSFSVNSAAVQIQDACGRTGSGSTQFFCPDQQNCEDRICDIDL